MFSPFTFNVVVMVVAVVAVVGVSSGVETFLEFPNTAAHLGASAFPGGRLRNTLLSPSQVDDCVSLGGDWTHETPAVFQRVSHSPEGPPQEVLGGASDSDAHR